MLSVMALNGLETLNFDFLILIFSLLRPSIIDAGPVTRQTDIWSDDGHQIVLCPRLREWGIITRCICLYVEQLTKTYKLAMVLKIP